MEKTGDPHRGGSKTEARSGRSYYWRGPSPELVSHLNDTRQPSAHRHTPSGWWLVYDLTGEDRTRSRTRKRKIYISAETGEGYG